MPALFDGLSGETRQLRPFLRHAIHSLRGGVVFVQHRFQIIFVIFASIPAMGGILVFLWAVLQALVHWLFSW